MKKYLFLILLFILIFFILFKSSVFIPIKYYTKNIIEDNLNVKLVIENIDGNIISSLNFYEVSLLDKTNNELVNLDKITIKYNIFRYLIGKDIINSISIIQPNIRLIRRKDGRWNVEELFKVKKKEELKVKLLPKVNISEGKVILTDNLKNFKLNFDKINVKITNLGRIKIEGNVENKKFYADGIVQLPNLLIDIKSKEQDLSTYSNLINNKNFNIISGKFNIDLRLCYKDNISYSGNLILKDTVINSSYINHNFKNIAGKILFTNNLITIKNLNSNSDNSTITIEGIIYDYDKEEPKINLLINCNNLEKKYISNILPQIQKIGLNFPSVNCNLFLFDKLSHPKLIGELFIKEGSYQTYRIHDLISHIRYSNYKLEIIDANFKTLDGEVTLSGVVKLFDDEPKYIITLLANNVNYNNIRLDADTIIVKTSSPKILTNLNIKKYKNIDVINCILSNEGDNTSINSIIANIGKGVIVGDGTFQKNKLDLILTGREIPLWLLNKNIDSEGDIKGKLTDRLDNPKFTGFINLRDGKFLFNKYKIDFDKAAGSVNFSDNILDIKNMYVNSKNYNINIDGRINLNKKYIELSGDIIKLDLEKVSKFYNKKANIIGNVNGDINISGYFDNPKKLKVDGYIFTDYINLFNQSIDTPYISFGISNNKLNFVTYSKINNAPVQVTGKISLEKDNSTDITFNINNLELSDINLIKKYRDTKGKVELNGKFTGSLKYPNINVNINGDSILLEDEIIEKLNSDINLTKDRIEATHKFKIKNGEYFIYNAGKKEKENTFLLSTNYKIKEGDVKSIVNISRLEKFKDLEGTLSSAGKLKMRFENYNDKLLFSIPTYYLDIATSLLYFKEKPMGKLISNINYENDILSINNFLMETEKGKIIASGIVDKLGKVNIEAKGENIDIGIIKPYLEEKKDLSGNLNFKFHATGESTSPIIIGKIHIDDIRFYGANFDNLQGDVEFKNNFVHLTNFKLDKEKEFYADLNGYIPFDINNLKILPDKEMNIHLVIKEANLDSITSFTEFIEDTDGKLKSDILISGNLDNIKLNGIIEVDTNKIKINKLEEVIRELNGKIKIVDNKVIIENLTGRLGKGRFKSTGDVEIVNFLPKYYNLQFNAKDIYVSIPPNLKGNITSDIILKGDVERPVIDGFIKVTDFDYVLVLTPEVKSLNEILPLPNATTINLKLVAGENFWMRNANLRMKTHGEFEIRGKLDNLKITGEMKSNRGTLAYFSQTFQIKEAIILFENPYEFTPTLFIRATTFIEVGQNEKKYKLPVEIVFDTKLKKEEELFTPDEKYTAIQLSWDDSHLPHSLSRKDVLRYLTIGRLLKEDIEVALIEEVKSMLQHNLLGFKIFAPAEQKVERLLNLSEFKLDYTLEEEFQLSVGKYLIKNLELSLIKIFSKEVNQTFSLRYLINPKRYISFPISLELVQKGEYTEYKSSIGIKYEF